MSEPAVSPHPPITAVREAVGPALAEDLTPLGDVTSALVDPAAQATAELVARAAGTVAGLPMRRRDLGAARSRGARDLAGRRRRQVDAGAVLAVVEGSLASVLTGERTALNFLGHLSGVATATRRFADAAGATRVWDTRKTTPVSRAREGGGARRRWREPPRQPQRVGDAEGQPPGGRRTVGHGRPRPRGGPARTVHVECDTFEQALEAVDAGAHAILLDNMSPDEARCAVGAGKHARAPP